MSTGGLTSRERVLLALDHKEADRVALYDSFWPTTVERWHQEGLPEDKTPGELFNFEIVHLSFDRTLRLAPQILEETDEFTTLRDANGAVTRDWKHRASTPELIDFLIKDRSTWEEYNDCLEADESRVDWEQERRRLQQAREQGKFVVLPGSFGFQYVFSRIVGPMQTLLAMAEDPVWAKEMFDTAANQTIHMAEIFMAEGFEFDGAYVVDDLGYRNGLFFSPAMYRALIFPAHKRIGDFFKGRDIPVILHCCGNCIELLPQLIEAGIMALEPLEVKAGMDVIELKKQYGDVLTLIGGIDVRTWARGGLLEIEKEIATKVTFAKQGGGYVFHSDHSVPDNVDLSTYKKVVELALQYGRYG